MAHGYDIYSYAERIEGRRWNWDGGPQPFRTLKSIRHYAFLADIRNDWSVPPITAPRGLPQDMSDDVDIFYYHRGSCLVPRVRYTNWRSASWLTVTELSGFDYEKTFEDQAPLSNQDPQWWQEYENGTAGCRIKTYREFLGRPLFDMLHELQSSGAERIVFWFG